MNRPHRSIAETLLAAARRLTDAGIASPRLEARILLAHATGRTSEDLIRELTAPIDAADFDALIARRAAREPLAYILGWREFWSLRFRVSAATLIPRPETETLVEAALSLCPDREAPYRVLDLGTGTGCLLLAFLHERPRATGIGVDRSEAAVRLASQNAHDLRLAPRAAFFCGDWAQSVGAKFDLVLSNPPYIPAEDMSSLMRDVADYEPVAALDGGVRGLGAHGVIIVTLSGLLSGSGVGLLELGAGQAAAVASIAKAAGFICEQRLDLAGMPRAMILSHFPLKYPLAPPRNRDSVKVDGAA